MESLFLQNANRDTSDLKQSISYIDIDYEVFNDEWTTKSRSTIETNYYAILNAYRMWLMSKKYDYIRAPEFGGVILDNLLGNKIKVSPDNEEVVRNLIFNETAAKWPDILLEDVIVQACPSSKSWKVNIVAQDKQSKMVMADEVSLEGSS